MKVKIFFLVIMLLLLAYPSNSTNVSTFVESANEKSFDTNLKNSEEVKEEVVLNTISYEKTIESVFKSYRENLDSKSSLQSFTPHDPIKITNDANFTDYGFTGLGTQINPYRIEGYNISTQTDVAIYVAHTTKYFVIKDCLIMGNNAYNERGILLDNVTDETAIITDNIIQQKWGGIEINGSNSVSIVNNMFYNCKAASIRFAFSELVTIYNNTHIKSEEIERYSIYGWYSNYVNISHNIILTEPYNSSTDNEEIFLYWCFYANVNNNWIQNTMYGIILAGSCYSTVKDNTLVNNGLGILLSGMNGSSFSDVRNNFIINNTRGISLLDNHYSIVDSNTITGNITEGIYIHGTKFANITNNFIKREYNGELYFTTQGFYIYNSESNFVYNNTITNNFRFGILLEGSHSNAVEANNIKNNAIGICLKSSNYNVFTHNNLEQNRAHGFEIYTGTNNEIYLNNFIENYDLSAWPQGWAYNSQAVDSGLGNLWYSISSSTGNYWSNYWYIESHYAIDGDSNSSDLFPSGRNDTISPVIVEVTYSPVSPTFEEDITISANAYDNAGILRVEVHYRLGDGEIQIEELNLFHYSGIVGYFDIEIGPFAKNATINFSIVVEDYFENSVESEMYTFTIQTDEEEVTVNFSNFLVISVALATFTTFQTYQKLKRRT